MLIEAIHISIGWVRRFAVPLPLLPWTLAVLSMLTTTTPEMAR